MLGHETVEILGEERGSVPKSPLFFHSDEYVRHDSNSVGNRKTEDRNPKVNQNWNISTGVS